MPIPSTRSNRGFVIRHSDGRPYRNPAFWFNGALIPDFSSADARRWWLDKRAYLLDEIGIDGFKTDGSEHLQGRDIVASDGKQGAELVNAYPNQYIGAYYRFAREHRGGITFSRAGHTGAGAFPAHWAGDENSTWEAYRRSIVAGLSAAMSGVVFWGWDMPGSARSCQAPSCTCAPPLWRRFARSCSTTASTPRPARPRKTARPGISRLTPATRA